MKKFVKSLVSFLIIAGMTYACLVIIWAHFIPFGFLKKNMIYPIGGKGFTHSRLMDVDSVKNVDILFLGSSHTFRGFDPRIFEEAGISSFNMGSPSQTPLQTRLLLEEYLDRLNPELVVFEMYPATFQNDGVESTLDLIANSNCLQCSLEMAKNTSNIKTFNALIYDTFRETFGLNNDFRESLDKRSDTYIQGGFVESSVTTNLAPITDQIRENWESNVWEINEMQWREFQKIYDLLAKRKIVLELLQMPVTKAAFNLYSNNNYIDSLFNAQGSYYNFNSVSTLDDDHDFIDYHHLSQTGVEKTNTALIDRLVTLGYFKKQKPGT